MPSRRTIRVSEVLRKELGALLTRCQDLENRLVTVSAVDVSPDLREAFVYISLLDTDDESVREVMEILSRHRRDWQAAIGRRVKTKNTPHLNFRFDPAVERGDRVMAILEEIKRDRPEEG
ncbi:MAG: 30S ribosome-binding factor RbfA [Verrucomicrobiota bacterium]